MSIEILLRSLDQNKFKSLRLSYLCSFVPLWLWEYIGIGIDETAFSASDKMSKPDTLVAWTKSYKKAWAIVKDIGVIKYTLWLNCEARK